MPYQTQKVKGGIKNVNKETGKATSKKPMTKANAEKQKKAIAISDKDKMKEHSKHHTSKHMKIMREEMKKGASFDKAHKKAMKEEPSKKSNHNNKGLSEKQKKLPKKLQDAIMKKK